MIVFAARRVCYHLSLLLTVAVLTFGLFHLVAADPARRILGPNASAAEISALRTELGLDRSISDQFLRWGSHTLRFEFGRSFVDRRIVSEEVSRRIAISCALLSLSMIIVLIWVSLTVSLSVAGARRLAVSLDFLLASMPTMFAGVVIALVVSRFSGLSVFSGNLRSSDDWLALLPAAAALALYPCALLSRIARAEWDRVAEAPYILTAKAAGIPPAYRVVVLAGRNALVPLLSALSLQIPMLFSGAFVVELIFSVPGAGSLLLQSILNQDLPMIEGLVLASCLVVSASHLGTEVLQAIVDPRLRLASTEASRAA